MNFKLFFNARLILKTCGSEAWEELALFSGNSKISTFAVFIPIIKNKFTVKLLRNDLLNLFIEYSENFCNFKAVSCCCLLCLRVYSIG